MIFKIFLNLLLFHTPAPSSITRIFYTSLDHSKQQHLIHSTTRTLYIECLNVRRKRSAQSNVRRANIAPFDKVIGYYPRRHLRTIIFYSGIKYGCSTSPLTSPKYPCMINVSCPNIRRILNKSALNASTESSSAKSASIFR